MQLGDKRCGKYIIGSAEIGTQMILRHVNKYWRTIIKLSELLVMQIMYFDPHQILITNNTKLVQVKVAEDNSFAIAWMARLIHELIPRWSEYKILNALPYVISECHSSHQCSS